MSRIITAKDIANRDGFKSVTDWVRFVSKKLVEKGSIPAPWGGLVAGKPIPARIDYGRWIADCPYCGGAEYIDPAEPFLFCLSCGMTGNKNLALPITLPASQAEIEGVLLERPVDERRGGNDIDRALLAQPIYHGLSRSWLPHESVSDLRKQNLQAANNITKGKKTKGG